MVRRLRVSQIQNNINMLLYRLAGSYSYHARMACCALAPSVYGRMPMAQQLQVRGILMRFLTEEAPLVRSVVVDTLSDLAEAMDYHSIKWLFVMLEASAKEGSPRVRNKVLEICYRIAQSLHRATAQYSHNPAVLQELHLNRCKLLPFVNCSADDPDWQVSNCMHRYGVSVPPLVLYFLASFLFHMIIINRYEQPLPISVLVLWIVLVSIGLLSLLTT